MRRVVPICLAVGVLACTPRESPIAARSVPSAEADGESMVESPTATAGDRDVTTDAASEVEEHDDTGGSTGSEPLPQACLEAWPELPDDLPEEARACLQPLLDRRAELATRVMEPDTASAVPCALERLDESGVVVETGVVERFTPRERSLRFEEVDDEDPDLRQVDHQSHRFDRAGRLKSESEHDEQYFSDPKLPDCENFVDTKHRLDGRGWPRLSRKIISTCEGVDAGAITRSRKFRARNGWVGAKVSVFDRGDARSASEVWMPNPVEPLAHVECEYDECHCELLLRSCDGVELGKARGGRRGGIERWAWICPAATN